jgi:hypothetical protein
VDRWSYYIDLLRNGCSGDGTDIEGPRHGLSRNGRASGADLIRLSARADRDGERILPHSIVEKFTRNADGELVPLTPGSTAKVATTVTHAGIVTTERYEFEMGTPEANPTMRIR